MTKQERARTMLGRYADMRQRQAAQIKAGHPDWSEDERAVLLEEQHAMNVLELMHPELMAQGDWRNPDSQLSSAPGGSHRKGDV